MINQFFLDQWKQQAPWKTYEMVEQDLIISKALVDLFSNDIIRNNLAFKGGTALNKLFLTPPARYSEDIDLAQISSEPIGKTIDAIRDSLSWLGTPSWKVSTHSTKIFYKYLSNNNKSSKLKIEINIIEHINILKIISKDFQVKSDWFEGKANIKTFELDELIATKLKALYQRRKGRDLFDMWLVIDRNLIDINKVISIFQEYMMLNHNETITKAMFQKNLLEKKDHPDFHNDMSSLLTYDVDWNFEEAFNLIFNNVISLLPGEDFKNIKG